LLITNHTNSSNERDYTESLGKGILGNLAESTQQSAFSLLDMRCFFGYTILIGYEHNSFVFNTRKFG